MKKIEIYGVELMGAELSGKLVKLLILKQWNLGAVWVSCSMMRYWQSSTGQLLVNDLLTRHFEGDYGRINGNPEAYTDNWHARGIGAPFESEFVYADTEVMIVTRPDESETFVYLKKECQLKRLQVAGC